MKLSSFKNLFLFYITILILLSGCRPKGNLISETNIGAVPQGLIFERFIEGIILGKRISEPFGLATDLAANLYLVDAGNDRLVRFDRDFLPIREAGGYGSEPGLLNSPGYISIDNNLNLYVSDGGNQRITVFDTRLNYAKQIELIDPSDPIKFGRPSGVWVNQYGELWVGDRDKSKIWIFDNIGSYDRSIGGIESTGGYLLNPAGIISDNEGRTLVCDKGNNLVKIYDNFGIFLDQFEYINMEEPTGIAVDKYGNVWVLNSKSPNLLCFDPDGEKIYEPDRLDYIGERNLNNPADLTITLENKLIISDYGNDRLLVFQILYP